MNFQKYIDASFANYPETTVLNQFKKHIAKQMETRAEELRTAGLQDETVLYDLIVSLYPNLEKRYSRFTPTIHSDASLWDMTTRRGWYAV